MPPISISEVLQAIDVSTEEAATYAKYFDFLRSRGLKEKWKHFSIREFILSVSEIKKGYYSVLRRVGDEVLFRDPAEVEKVQWLKGWIFYKDNTGVWWIIVDGEKDRFEEFKKEYRRLKG